MRRRAIAAGMLPLVVALVLGACGGDEPQSLADGVGSTASTTSTTASNGIGGEEGAAIAAVLARLDAGQPSPYSQDGTTFQNREGLLPDEPLGYYREYTVETPGSADRGARRLVIGASGEIYYTNDHYASFDQIDPEDYR